jgi:hypothetical protein
VTPARCGRDLPAPLQVLHGQTCRTRFRNPVHSCAAANGGRAKSALDGTRWLAGWTCCKYPTERLVLCCSDRGSVQYCSVRCWRRRPRNRSTDGTHSGAGGCRRVLHRDVHVRGLRYINVATDRHASIRCKQFSGRTNRRHGFGFGFGFGLGTGQFPARGNVGCCRRSRPRSPDGTVADSLRALSRSVSAVHTRALAGFGRGGTRSRSMRTASRQDLPGLWLGGLPYVCLFCFGQAPAP